MSIDDPRSSISFQVAAGDPQLPDTSQAGLIIGVGTEFPLAFKAYGSGSAVRAAFEEAMLTEIAEAHFANDSARHPIAIVGSEASNDGVLYLDLSDFTGSSTVTADGTMTPLGDWPGVQIDVVEGGTIGQPGIILEMSIDEGRNPTRITLGTATSAELTDKGIKVNFSPGTLGSGSVIRGWTDPPRWTTAELQAAAQVAVDNQTKFSLLCIAEPLVPADGPILSAILDDLETTIPYRFVQLIGSKRRQYHPVAPVTIEATFANANPDTLSRAAGSFVTDGFKPGMRVIVADSVSNDGTYLKIATVAALTLTFTSNVAFVAEAATAGVEVSAEETEDDYGTNLGEEWASFSDTRFCLTSSPIRASRPNDGSIPDQNLGGYLWSRAIAEPIQLDPGQRKKTPLGGGTVAPKLGGRTKEGNARVLPDAAFVASLVLTPNRATALQTEADGTGPYFVRVRTMFQLGGTDAVKYLTMARILNAAKETILAIEVQEILSGRAADPSNPKKLSSLSTAEIESAGRSALQTRLAGAISNSRIEDPEGPLFAISPDTDLSTGQIKVDIFLRTLFYAEGFSNTLAIKAPGF